MVHTVGENVQEVIGGHKVEAWECPPFRLLEVSKGLLTYFQLALLFL